MNNRDYELSAGGIDKLLKNTTIGSTVYFYERVTSTFDELSKMPKSEGLTVAAANQTNGRGRLGRIWSSDRGGIYFSFMLINHKDAKDAPFITLICALAVQKVLEKYLPCQIKWPNDIVSDGKKICGILTKATLCGDGVDNIQVGIGINANNTKFPKELIDASSIKILTGITIDENKLFYEVISSIDKYYYNCVRQQILTEYKDSCVNLGESVTIHYTDGRRNLEGICTDILQDGSMTVTTKGGGITTVSSGEVSVRGIYNSERTKQ